MTSRLSSEPPPSGLAMSLKLLVSTPVKKSVENGRMGIAASARLISRPLRSTRIVRVVTPSSYSFDTHEYCAEPINALFDQCL